MKAFLQKYLRKNGLRMLTEWGLCAAAGILLGVLLQSNVLWVPAVCAAAIDALMQFRRVADRYRAACEAQDDDEAEI